jgi:hypothetical protein
VIAFPSRKLIQLSSDEKSDEPVGTVQPATTTTSEEEIHFLVFNFTRVSIRKDKLLIDYDS